MTTTKSVPQAVHLGADDLPFVEIGDGNKLKVIQVKPDEGLWIVENIFQAGTRSRSTATRAPCTPTPLRVPGSTGSTST